MGMLPIIIIMGIPMPIIAIMRSQHIFIMSMVIPAIGIIFITMPSLVISQVMRAIGMLIMFIIGIMPPIMGIMPPIIGIGICIIGIISFMGICIAGIMVDILEMRRLKLSGEKLAGLPPQVIAYSTSKTILIRYLGGPSIILVTARIGGSFDGSVAGKKMWDDAGMEDWVAFLAIAGFKGANTPRFIERQFRPMAEMAIPEMERLAKENGVRTPPVQQIIDCLCERIDHLDRTFGWTIGLDASYVARRPLPEIFKQPEGLWKSRKENLGVGSAAER